MKLSAVINTKNAAKTLDKCLNSVSFADEIIVVDMHSTDQTIKIAKKFTDKIFTHKDLGYADPARDWSINKASHNWVLVVDADEEVPVKLRSKIKDIIQQTETADVYLIPRKNIIFKEWIQSAGWWPDYQPRLFKKGHVSWQVGVHRMPDLEGDVEKLPLEEELALLHHNYQSVEQFINRLNRYTGLQAKENWQPEQISTVDLINHFRRELNQRLFALEGVKSQHGTVLSFLQAMSQLVVLAKQWEILGFPSEEKPNQTTAALKQIQQDLAYWTADYYVKNSSGPAKLYWQIRRKLKI